MQKNLRWKTWKSKEIVTRKLWPWTISLLLGLSLALTYANQFFSAIWWRRPVGELVLIGLYLVLLFTLATYGLVFYLTWPYFKSLSDSAKTWWRRIALLEALLIGLMLVMTTPIKTPAPPQIHTLEIIATGEKNAHSGANQVWLRKIWRTVDGQSVPLEELQRHGLWQKQANNNNVLFSNDDQPASLRWSGVTYGDLQIAFGAHAWSGVAEIIWDDHKYRLDLYNEDGSIKRILLPAGTNSLNLTPAGLGYYIAYTLSLTALTVLITFWLGGGFIFGPVSLKRPTITKRSLKIWVIGLTVVLLPIPLARNLSPWFYAATTPVQLKLEAPRNTALDLCWDNEKQACMPLVPYVKPGTENVGDTAKLWLGELPPLPAYNLSLIFRSPVNQVALRGLTLLDTQKLTPIYEQTIAGGSQEIDLVGVEVQATDKVLYLTAPPGGRLDIPAKISPAMQQPDWLPFVIIWLRLVSAVLIIGTLGLPLLWPEQKVVYQLTPLNFPRNFKIWLAAFFIATAAHVLLVVNSPTLVMTDTIHYLEKAVYLAEYNTYETGAYRTELIRLPGYPLLLAAIFKFFGYHITTVAIWQVILLGVGGLSLTLALRHWLHPVIGAISLCFIILSPAQVLAARTIMTESSFAAFVMFSLAAFFEHLQHTGRRSQGWLLIYAIFATFTTFIRPNGVVLFAAIIPVLLPKVISLLFFQKSGFWTRTKLLINVSWPYMIVGAILVVSLFNWSLRNHIRRNYFGPTDMTGPARAAGLMETGIFDARSLLRDYPPVNQDFLASSALKISDSDPNFLLYKRYILGKYNHSYHYHIWYIRDLIHTALTERGAHLSNESIPLLNSTLRQIVAASNSFSSRQLRFIAWLRAGWWAAALPTERKFSREHSYVDYRITLDYFDLDYHTDMFRRLSAKFIYDAPLEENWLTTTYSAVAGQYYNSVYPIWLILALLSSIYILWRRRRPILSIPLFIYTANILLNTYLLNISTRYIHALDMLLIFQIALGMSLFLESKIDRRIET